MNEIRILDCTLRDGGYINDWFFGKQTIKGIANDISSAGVDYIEVGFIRDEEYFEDQAQFSALSQISDMFYPKKSNIKFAGMIEMGYPYSLDKIPERDDSTIDLFRVVMWKRMLNEGLEYCKALQAKGYEVGVQASRIEQYSFEEFESLVKLFNTITPKAIYIVDTFGLLERDVLLEYMKIADRLLDNSIAIGYHAHNNLQQAMPNAISLIEHQWNHPIMIDTSIMGIGRGAGNLNSELFLRYLNSKCGTNYNISPIINSANDYLTPVYEKAQWGYSLPYYFSAIYACNPCYATYFTEKKLSYQQMEKIFSTFKNKGEGIQYSEKLAENAIESYLK